MGHMTTGGEIAEEWPPLTSRISSSA